MSQSYTSPPSPIVKISRTIGDRKYKTARGFSIGEIEAVGLNIMEARRIGIYVDERRKSVYQENIDSLKEWLKNIDRDNIPSKVSTLPKILKIKKARGRVFRGRTMAGRRMRGLLKIGLRETHRYKWKRKHRERILRKRHEARFSKGGD